MQHVLSYGITWHMRIALWRNVPLNSCFGGYGRYGVWNVLQDYEESIGYSNDERYVIDALFEGGEYECIIYTVGHTRKK